MDNKNGFGRNKVNINDMFWGPRLEMNSNRALFYQWEQYEKCGTLDNFRITAGVESGQREGFFYTDSDLYKWADAASRALASGSNRELELLLDECIRLIIKAQAVDGYIYTFNQIYFPEVRWKNIKIEH